MAIDRETITHDEWCALPVEARQAIYTVAALKRVQIPGAGYGDDPVVWCICCGDESDNAWACDDCWRLVRGHLGSPRAPWVDLGALAVSPNPRAYGKYQ